jgi:hypothetical protein
VSPSSSPTSRVISSIVLGLPPLTRTEEKSLACELIAQLPINSSFAAGEKWAQQRACEIIRDNYSHTIMPIQISNEWFYDFLLRNPRLPIHFRGWFAMSDSSLPSSEHLIDIKMWELKLIAHSAVQLSSISASSSSSS